MDGFRKPSNVRLLFPLRERRFALYLIGQLLSQIGDGIYLVTRPFIMLDQGGPANLVAGLGVSAAFSVGFFSRPYRNF